MASLWWIMLAGSFAVTLLVLALLALAFWKGPQKAKASVWLIGGGLVFPGVVLAALLATGLILGERMIPPSDAKSIEVEAEATQFRWRFSYPGTALLPTENLLRIPAGVPVTVNLTTKDVIHSFWVPQLAGKMDAVPGRTNRLAIEAFAPGQYQGLCAEYCGTGHARHGFVVIAHSAEEWQALTDGGAP